MLKEKQLANCKAKIQMEEELNNHGTFTPGEYYFYTIEYKNTFDKIYKIKDDNDKEVIFEAFEFEYLFIPYEKDCYFNMWEIMQIHKSIKALIIFCDDNNKINKLRELEKKISEYNTNILEDMRNHDF